MTQETTNTSPTSTERELTAEELEDVRGGTNGSARRNAAQQAFAHKWNNGGSATAASMSNNNKKK